MTSNQIPRLLWCESIAGFISFDGDVDSAIFDHQEDLEDFIDRFGRQRGVWLCRINLAVTLLLRLPTVAWRAFLYRNSSISDICWEEMKLAFSANMTGILVISRLPLLIGGLFFYWYGYNLSHIGHLSLPYVMLVLGSEIFVTFTIFGVWYENQTATPLFLTTGRIWVASVAQLSWIYFALGPPISALAPIFACFVGIMTDPRLPAMVELLQ
jgi:hypothetical protein